MRGLKRELHGLDFALSRRRYTRNSFFLFIECFVFLFKLFLSLGLDMIKELQKFTQLGISLLLTNPLFTHYHDLFYKDRKKIVPSNIYDLMTPVVLAFWIMCDGYKYNAGVALATNSFSISDNELLIDALNRKFGFSCWIINDHGQPSIFIPRVNLRKLQELVVPHIHTSLLYKIHL
uniref:Orf176 protein n=1 Tax=Allomyces macrogynus TaxID=28583 RepID=Q33760_ALLMA|nr:hypothetical protein AlmafMp16 [Allomyces macrogynus]AAC49236.1 OMEGA orf [Allomyces macrogynus]